MGTDPEPTMRNKADQQLVEIDKKYTGFIHVSLCNRWALFHYSYPASLLYINTQVFRVYHPEKPFFNLTLNTFFYRWRQSLGWKCRTTYNKPSTCLTRLSSEVSDKTRPTLHSAPTSSLWYGETGSIAELSSFHCWTSLMTVLWV